MASILDSCRTTSDLAKLLARYARGQVSDPIFRKLADYQGAPADAILPALESGEFAILDALPGLEGRRAAVFGFLTPRGLRRLDRLSIMERELAVARCFPGMQRQPGVVVSSGVTAPQQIFHFLAPKQMQRVSGTGAVPAALLDDLALQTQVIVYDSKWGRNDRLWPALQRAFS